MANKEALDYIFECLRQKIEPQAIRAHLEATGYPKDIIEEAFKEAETKTVASPAPQLAPSLEARLVADGVPGFTNLLSFAWHELFSRPGVYFGIQAVPIALTVLLSFLDNPFRGLNGRITVEAFSQATALSPTLTIPLALLTLFSWFLNLLAPLALLYAYHETLPILAAYKRALKNTYRYLWTLGLAGLVIAGGFLFFAVPGILFSIWFVPVMYIFAFEGIGGMRALHKSREYVRGHVFTVFVRLFVLGLLFTFLLFGLAMILGGLTYVWVVSNALTGNRVALLNTFWLLSSFIFAPLWLFYGVAIYKKLAFLTPDAGADYPKGTRAYWLIPFLGLVVFLIIFIGGAALVARFLGY